MGQTREQKVLKQLTQTPQVQKQTQISEGMFLPNHSGLHHDIHTDGDIYIYKPTTNDYKITSDSGGHLAIEGQTSGAQVQLALYSKDGDGTDGVFFGLVGKGTIADSTTALEKLNFRYAAGTTNFVIFTQASGTGTVRPLTLYTGANTSQLVLNIDGTTTITNGIYNSSDGTAGMTGTKTFLDATARTNTITIKNGLITAWSQC